MINFEYWHICAMSARTARCFLINIAKEIVIYGIKEQLYYPLADGPYIFKHKHLLEPMYELVVACEHPMKHPAVRVARAKCCAILGKLRGIDYVGREFISHTLHVCEVTTTSRRTTCTRYALIQLGILINGDPIKELLYDTIFNDIIGPVDVGRFKIPESITNELKIHANPTTKAIANEIYDKQDYTGMTILGDALEDSGCTNQVILQHCHNNVKHYRGCWLIDRLLNKK